MAATTTSTITTSEATILRAVTRGGSLASPHNTVDTSPPNQYDVPTSHMSEIARYRLFIENYDAYKHKIYNYFYYRAGHDAALAEDLTSDTFVKAYEHIDSYNAQFAFSTWVYSIARNVLIDHLRKAALRNSEELDDSIKDEDAEMFIDTLDTHIDIERVRSSMAELTDAQREVIHLRYFEYKEISEIAADKNADPAAVRKNISRGLQRMRELLAAIVIIFTV